MSGIIIHGRRFDCKLLIFDMDGTLIDEGPRFMNLARARAEAMRELLDEEFVEEWARLSGVDLKRGEIDMNGPLARASRREDTVVASTAMYLRGKKWTEARRMAEEIYGRADEMLKGKKETLFSGVGTALERLKASGLKLAVATNEGSRVAEEIMFSIGVRDLFDFFVGADDVVNPKPAADMVLLACERCGCSPSQAVMIGDQPADLMAGRKASVGLIVAVRSKTVQEAEVMDLADIVIDSVAELDSF